MPSAVKTDSTIALWRADGSDSAVGLTDDRGKYDTEIVKGGSIPVVAGLYGNARDYSGGSAVFRTPVNSADSAEWTGELTIEADLYPLITSGIHYWLTFDTTSGSPKTMFVR